MLLRAPEFGFPFFFFFLSCVCVISDKVSCFVLLLSPHFNNSSYLQRNFSLFCVASWDCLYMQKCVLKVNIHCDGCKNKVKKILQKIDGMLSIYQKNLMLYLISLLKALLLFFLFLEEKNKISYLYSHIFEINSVFGYLFESIFSFSQGCLPPR